jgi:hypothetical protein
MHSLLADGDKRHCLFAEWHRLALFGTESAPEMEWMRRSSGVAVPERLQAA